MKKKSFKAALALVNFALVFSQVGNSQSPFTQGNLVVYRVGDGISVLANTGNPVFLDEYTTSGILVQSVPMPTSQCGSNKPLVAAGTATAEGLMNRSVDGHYLLLGGYATTIPYASSLTLTTSDVVPRVIGVVTAGAVINTSTALTDAASAGSPRGVCSTDGNDLWISGSTGGGRYTTLGSTTSIQLTTTPSNLRALNIFNGQLYASSQSGAFRLSSIGVGIPITSGQTTTNLPGFPTSTGSPYGFYFADLDERRADICYL
jgi:hypothetical protein